METTRDNTDRKSLAFLLALCLCGVFSRSLDAAPPSQKDVFKSIQDSVGHQTDFNSTPALLWALGGAGVLLVLVALSKREQKVATPTVLNSAGKLNKEVLKQVALKPAEIKQLKMLAESLEADIGEVPDPLTLLLCPSLLARAVQDNPAKLDRKAVAQVVRKMRLGQTRE